MLEIKKVCVSFLATSDAHTSDEDHLIIDLSEDSMDCEEKKVQDNTPSEATPVIPLSSETEKVTMKKFPGLIPLFTSEFYKNGKEIEKIIRPKTVSRTNSFEEDNKSDDSLCMINPVLTAKKTSVSSLPALQPVQDEITEVLNNQKVSVPATDFKSLKSQVSSALNTGNKLLDSSVAQTIHLKNGQTPTLVSVSVSSKKPFNVNEGVQRHTLHRTCNDVRILHGVGDMYADLSRSSESCQEVKKTFPEEIIIDDSDDEVIELDETTLKKTSEPSVVESSSRQTYDVNIEKGSQMQVTTHL
ncbi:UNVERIFIED_CONTAM: hypothetical protein NCL1_21223 [Trichonephila clavipes]